MSGKYRVVICPETVQDQSEPKDSGRIESYFFDECDALEARDDINKLYSCGVKLFVCWAEELVTVPQWQQLNK